MDEYRETDDRGRDDYEEEHREEHYTCFTFVIALNEDGEYGRDNGANRGEKYDRRRAHALELRDAVMDWLQKQGIEHGDVSDVSEPTVFGTFTVETTPAVARLLEQAPHVTHVIPADDVSFDLLRAV